MNEDQIKHMAERFLRWRLPDDFRPDAGISFSPIYNGGTPYAAKQQPVGTNLFTAAQAEAMARHMVEGIGFGEAPEAQSWRPIETAPKDGTEILAFGPYGDRPQTVAFRNAEWRCSHGSRVIESEGDFGIKYKRADPLSHWMPLPEGPKP